MGGGFGQDRREAIRTNLVSFALRRPISLSMVVEAAALVGCLVLDRFRGTEHVGHAESWIGLPCEQRCLLPDSAEPALPTVLCGAMLYPAIILVFIAIGVAELISWAARVF